MGLVKFLCDFRVNAGPIDTRFEYAGLTVQALESRELFALVELLTLNRDDVSLRPNKKSGEREPDYRIMHEQGAARLNSELRGNARARRGEPSCRLYLTILRCPRR